MRELFLKATELVKLVPAIKFSDLDKGQIDNYDQRPAVAFPAVLLKIELPNTADIGGKKQQCQARVTLRIAFDYTGQTSCNTPSEALEQSLSYFDVVDELYQVFQGYFGEGFTRFSRLNLTEEKRKDGLKVVNMPFSTTYLG